MSTVVYGWPYLPKPYQTRVRYRGKDGRSLTLTVLAEAHCLEFAEKQAKAKAKTMIRQLHAAPGTILEVRTIPFVEEQSAYSRSGYGMKEEADG